jgi:hypothetical protein
MRYLLLLSLIAANFLAACDLPVKGRNGEVYKSPVQYNDYIVSRQTKITNNIIQFGEVSGKYLDSADHLLDIYANETGELINDLKDMPPYKGDSLFRNSAVDLFIFYKKIFSNEYKRMVIILRSINKKTTGNEGTAEEIAELQRITDALTREENKYDKALHKAQKNFAVSNNMRLRDNEVQKKVDDINK